MRPLINSQARVFEYVEHTARLGSIRRAAEALGVASSAVNRLIIEYELSLGAELFERTSKGVQLTAAGELLVGHIRRATRDFGAVRAQIESLRGLQSGHVSVAVIEAIPSSLLAEHIVAYQQRNRRVTMDVRVLGSQEVVEAVLDGRCELGIAINPSFARRFHKLASAHYALHAFVAATHPLAQHRELRLSDCVGFPLILGDASFGGRKLLDQMMGESTVPLTSTVSTNSVHLMEALAEQSEAIFFQVMPAGRPTSPANLVALPVSENVPHIEVVLGMDGHTTLSAVAAGFADFLGRAFSDASTVTRSPPHPPALAHAGHAALSVSG